MVTLYIVRDMFKEVWHFDITLRYNLNEGRGKGKRVEDVFLNILFLARLYKVQVELL